jgi:flagellar hook assembly protein FlgD
MNEEQNAGYKSITWDGTNDDGEKVSAGVYFYQMHTSNGDAFTKSKKLLKLN